MSSNIEYCRGFDLASAIVTDLTCLAAATRLGSSLGSSVWSQIEKLFELLIALGINSEIEASLLTRGALGIGDGEGLKENVDMFVIPEIVDRFVVSEIVKFLSPKAKVTFRHKAITSNSVLLVEKFDAVDISDQSFGVGKFWRVADFKVALKSGIFWSIAWSIFFSRISLKKGLSTIG